MTATLPIFDQMSALADGTRCRVLLVLERQEMTVAELCAVLQLPQSTVSRHLRVLADDGWIVAREDGASNRYSVVGERLEASARRLWTVVREQVAATPAARHDEQRVHSVLARRRSRSQEFFASSAGQWDRMRAELFGQRADLLTLLALLDPSWTVGDLGCGSGHITEALAPAVGRVIAVDESSAMLTAARRRLGKLPTVEIRRGTLESLPIGSGELDAAVCLLALHYVAQPEAAVAEMFRVLAPGGVAVIADMIPHDRAEYEHTMGHLWRGFSEETMLAWLRAAGFVQHRFVQMTPDPNAKGPTLFVARGRRPDKARRIAKKND